MGNNSFVSDKKKVGRITYQFNGWYTNEACTGNQFDFVNDTITEDTTFYAKYVPISEETDVTITKQVTGLLGDTNKEFEFSATVTMMVRTLRARLMPWMKTIARLI